MSVLDVIGAPQIAAVLMLAQRGAEELYSARNTKALLAEGASEAGANYYPVIAATHLAWIAGIFFLIPASAQVIWPLIAIYVLLQLVRYWIITNLGRYWTHRIITLPQAPIVTRGPYGYINHPNYAVTLAETLLLPLAFGAVAFAIIMTTLWWTVLRYKVALEDEALAARRATQSSSARK